MSSFCLGLHLVKDRFDFDDSNDLQEDLQILVDINLKTALWVCVFALQELAFTTFNKGLENIFSTLEIFESLISGALYEYARILVFLDVQGSNH